MRHGRRAPGLCWIIRLRPEAKSSLYVRALVFERKAGLRAFGRAFGLGNLRKTRAFAGEIEKYRIRKGEPRRKRPVVAVAAFWKGDIGSGLVAHEMFHATMFWARRRRVAVAPCADTDKRGTLTPDHPEERLAEVQGELVRQFVSRAYQLRFYPAEP